MTAAALPSDTRGRPTLEWFMPPPLGDGSPVVATGVFDVLHRAHIRFLSWTASGGRPLYVGVEADDRVKAWKGPGRPVNPVAERAEIVAALKAVAAVFIIAGDPDARTGPDDVELLTPIAPAALAFSAGDPHRHAKLAAADALAADALEFPYQPGYSTTSIIDRLRAQQRSG